MMNKTALGPIVPIEPAQALLEEKTELATKTVDMLMFHGPVKTMLAPLAKMVGIPELTVGVLFPQKNRDNLRLFLSSLNAIMNHVLDDQVSFNEFVPELARHIEVIKRIAEEEK